MAVLWRFSDKGAPAKRTSPSRRGAAMSFGMRKKLIMKRIRRKSPTKRDTRTPMPAGQRRAGRNFTATKPTRKLMQKAS